MASGKLQIQNILALIIIALLGFVAYKLVTQPQALPSSPAVTSPLAENTQPQTQPKSNVSATTAPTDTNQPENEAVPTPPFVTDLAIRSLIDHYPEVPLKTVKWQQQKYGLEAIFKDGSHNIEVEFDKTGNWIETEFENVRENEIPFEVRELVKKQFLGAVVQEYEIEHTKEGTFYEIELNYKGQEIEKYVDSKGNIAVNSNEDS